MFNDKLSQISLERLKRKNRQEKSRKTQSFSNFKNANSYALDPLKRITSNICTVSAEGDLFISYENGSPSNSIKKNSNFSFGNVKRSVYKPFDESSISKKERAKNFHLKTNDFFTSPYTIQERKNAKVDVFKRNTDITILDNNYPFPSENISYAKCSIGESLKGKNSTSQIVSSFYEDFDSKDSFVDDQETLIKSGVYITNKNHYNQGKIKPFVEKDNVKNNSILLTKDSNNQYYKDSKYFKTSGFVYKSKRPDSIAFGGLKR